MLKSDGLAPPPAQPLHATYLQAQAQALVLVLVLVLPLALVLALVLALALALAQGPPQGPPLLPLLPPLLQLHNMQRVTGGGWDGWREGGRAATGLEEAGEMGKEDMW